MSAEVEEVERRPDNPQEWTRDDYQHDLETSRDAALEKMANYPEEYDTIHHAVEEAIMGDRMINNYGYRLVTVLMSETSPGSPDYCEPWSTYADLSDPDSLTWSDCIRSMAYVCYYSDVYEAVVRSPPGWRWERVGPKEYRSTDTGTVIDVGETQGGFYRVDVLTDAKREPVGSGDTLADALDVAEDWIREHPEG